MRPILFLDCDGVMNRITPSGYVPPHPGLDPVLVARVATCVERHDCDVVVSSSWRENYTLDQLRALMPPLAGRLCGATVVLDNAPGRRAREVAQYMAAHPNTRYVIVDDSKKHGFPPERFVRTDGTVGFQERDAARVAEILG